MSPAGVTGTAIYVAADGLIKASLFLCVGILQHRYSRVDEVRLRGFGRELPFTGLVFAAGGLAFAATPPFGTFLGKAVIEHAAIHDGYVWVPPGDYVAWLTLGVAVFGVLFALALR